MAVFLALGPWVCRKITPWDLHAGEHGRRVKDATSHTSKNAVCQLAGNLLPKWAVSLFWPVQARYKRRTSDVQATVQSSIGFALLRTQPVD